MHDVVIRGGTIVDGTGEPGRSGDVAIDGATITLPAGGRRLVQRTDGYRQTVKDGQVTFENGEATGVLPGVLLRGPQAVPA